MSFDPRQFRDLIVRTLREFNLCSAAAVNLLLGTAAKESEFGTFLRQLGGGPALGAFQVEPATFEWLQDGFADRYEELAAASAADLEWNLRLSILVARLRYRVVPEALPAGNDVPGMAAYWKRYYNTIAGRGTVAEFIDKYRTILF